METYRASNGGTGVFLNGFCPPLRLYHRIPPAAHSGTPGPAGPPPWGSLLISAPSSIGIAAVIKPPYRGSGAAAGEAIKVWKVGLDYNQKIPLPGMGTRICLKGITG